MVGRGWEWQAEMLQVVRGDDYREGRLWWGAWQDLVFLPCPDLGVFCRKQYEGPGTVPYK